MAKRKDKAKQEVEVTNNQSGKMNDPVKTPGSDEPDSEIAAEPGTALDEEADAISEDKSSEAVDMVSAEEFAALKDKYLRTVAEYDNFRKRTQKEKLALYTSSVTDVVKNWLPVLDNLDRAVEAAEKYQNDESKLILEGIEMVRKQAIEVMKQLGVEEIDCLGKQFNPEYHEALAHVENPQYDENQIFEVIKKGYIKGDQVLRHSQVCVAN